MKVVLGNYKGYIGPYQIARSLRYIGIPEHKTDDLGCWLDKSKTLVNICEWVTAKRKRKIKIHIDEYDIWALDHTLALIIAPGLKKLLQQQHGAGYVDDEDVPENIRSNIAGIRSNDVGEVDKHWHDRWVYVLTEMIFAFESISKDPDYEDQMHNGTMGIRMVPVDKNGNEIPRDNAKLFIERELIKPYPKFDGELYKDYNARMENGYRLFGRYFRQLWD